MPITAFFPRNRYKSSHSQVLYQISILNKLVEFTGKHLYQSLFLKKTLSLKLHLKKDSGTGAFQWILRIFSEHFFYSTPAIGRVVLEVAIPMSFLWVLHNSKITFHIENISRQSSAWFIYDKATSSWYQAHFKKVVPQNFIKSLVTGWKCDLWLLSRKFGETFWISFYSINCFNKATEGGTHQ